MEINTRGLVDSVSVQNARRVSLKLRETDTIKSRLCRARRSQTVKPGEIAVIEDREFMRVDGIRSKSIFWIEVERLSSVKVYETG